MREIVGGWKIIWGMPRENLGCMLEVVWQPRGYQCQPRRPLSESGGDPLLESYGAWPSLGPPLPCCLPSVQYCHSRDIWLIVCQGASALSPWQFGKICADACQTSAQPREDLVLMHVRHQHYSGKICADAVRRTSALLFAKVQRVSEPGVASWNRPAPGPVTTLPTKVQLLRSPLLPLERWHTRLLDTC